MTSDEKIYWKKNYVQLYLIMGIWKYCGLENPVWQQFTHYNKNIFHEIDFYLIVANSEKTIIHPTIIDLIFDTHDQPPYLIQIWVKQMTIEF